MQNRDGFDNLASSVDISEEVEYQPSSLQSRISNMSHVNMPSSTKSSNYDYHRRKEMSTILVNNP